MDTENEQAQVEDVQEESTQEEEVESTEPELETVEEEDDSISLSKSELNKLKRKAIAYDSLKKTATSPSPKVDKQEVSNDVSERFERLELKADGYSQEEIDEIMNLGGSKVLNTKFIQSAIKAMRAEKKSKDATIEASSRSPVFKKYTQEDLSKMSSKEMEKILSEQ